ncbi:MAG TPA: hypothetical protein VEA58_08925 [Anaerovoracaceae bacterium]|nr:hypothetical protein [Anaerovoracaceae bacterium]
MDNTVLILAIAIYYFLMCLIVGVVSEKKGYNLGGVIFVAVICTPLIAAVLYSQEKRGQNADLS